MDYLTIAQAATEIGVSPRTLRRRIMDGDVQGELVHSRLLLVPRAEVDRLRGVGPRKRGPKGPKQSRDAASAARSK